MFHGHPFCHKQAGIDHCSSQTCAVPIQWFWLSQLQAQEAQRGMILALQVLRVPGSHNGASHSCTAVDGRDDQKKNSLRPQCGETTQSFLFYRNVGGM